MPRKAKIPGAPNTALLTVRVSQRLLEYVDQERGEESRGEFIRTLIRGHKARHDPGRVK